MTGIEASGQLFSQAAVLMMVGMLFVFAFLSLLIVVIKVLITPLGQRYPDQVAKKTSSKSNQRSDNESSAVVAAISVAINQYRQKHK